jgi:CarD family transcriptional regulator
MFALNEKVFYPGHGVARVSRVMERVVGGCVTHFYELRFLSKDMTILVPIDNLASVGVRTLSSSDHIHDVFKLLSCPTTKDKEIVGDVCVSNWNKRNKKYQAALRSGDAIEIAKIYRDLHYLSQVKELSFGERTVLVQIEELLAEEISMVQHIARQDAIDHLRSYFEPTHIKQQKVSAPSV